MHTCTWLPDECALPERCRREGACCASSASGSSETMLAPLSFLLQPRCDFRCTTLGSESVGSTTAESSISLPLLCSRGSPRLPRLSWREGGGSRGECGDERGE